MRGLGGAAVSAAADLGRSGVLTQGRAHMTWHASRQVLTGLCHVALWAWYGLLCACRWVTTACALGEVALLLLVCGAVPLWAVANLT